MNHKEIIEKVGTTFLLTVAAYFVAYIFEVSYLRSFGISWQAARVTISSLIVSFIVLISLGVCLNPLLGLFIGIPKKIKTEMERFVYERVFEFGEFMRKTRIDEVPQCINVLRGQMHLIGPRPERRHWINFFEKEIPYYNERHIVRPGITGWAQVNYPYGSNTHDAKQKLMYDLYYIKHWSLWLEVKIIVKTIAIIFEKRGI